eukprot:15170179-Alexandrium_andersonii.AAC.1
MVVAAAIGRRRRGLRARPCATLLGLCAVLEALTCSAQNGRNRASEPAPLSPPQWAAALESHTSGTRRDRCGAAGPSSCHRALMR